MTTPNNQPTHNPPPGMEILTDYTKPLPEGAMFKDSETGTWHQSPRIGNLPVSWCIYAIPITQTESEVKTCAAPSLQQCQQTTPNVTATQPVQSKTTEPVGPATASNSPANVPSVSTGNCPDCAGEPCDAHSPHPSPGEQPSEQREELKPCPFCGGLKSEVVNLGDIYVRCLNNKCRAFGPSAKGDDEQEAISLWNTRA